MKLKHRNLKLHLNFLLIILFLVPAFYSCKDDLPRETQDGRNTFGMLVDGEKWEATNDNFLSLPKINSFYYGYNNTITIEAFNEVQNKVERINFTLKNISEPGLYKMNYVHESNRPCFDSTSFQKKAFDCFESYWLVDNEDSHVEITRFDLNRMIISGRFRANFFSKMTNKKLSVTEGRFDLTMNK